MNMTQAQFDALPAHMRAGMTISKSAAECLAEIERPKGKGQKFQDQQATDRYKSKAERIYAAQLEDERRLGLIDRWEYEALAFRLGDGCVYWPDFIVWNQGWCEVREVKGRGKFAVRPAARVKFLAAQKMYPEFRWIMLQRNADGWEQIY